MREPVDTVPLPVPGRISAVIRPEDSFRHTSLGIGASLSIPNRVHVPCLYSSGKVLLGGAYP